MKKIGWFVPFIILLHIFPSLNAQIVYEASDTTRLPEVYLEETEITSMRESGRISALPLSAGVLDMQELHRQQTNSLKETGTFIPNLFMPDYGSRLTSPVYIRGIGSRINAPSVGLYVDNIPYFEKSVFEFNLLNVERIEVLRGPQGTLYGRNTMGGLINVYSTSPFKFQGTHLHLTGGNPAYLNTGVSHQQLLSDNAGLSVSAGLNRHDGFFKNEYTGNMADQHFSAGSRVRLSWQLSPEWLAEFTTHSEYLDQGGYPYALHDKQTGVTSEVSYNDPSSYSLLMNSNGLLFNYSTPRVMMQSVSAFQFFSDNQSIDQDFTPADLVFAIQEQSQYMLSQEITARSNHNDRYQWVFGVFGFYQQLDNDLDIQFGEDAVAFGMVPAEMSRLQYSSNRIHGSAVFHQSTLKGLILPKLSLTAGVRLDYEKATLDHLGYMEADFETPPPVDFESALDFYEVLPRFALLYDLFDETNFFAAITRGYKTGGFNVIFESEQDRSFDPEFSWNYEIGIRGVFLDNRLNLETALFYIDWKNQQIYQMLPSGQGAMLSNAGASVSKGAEVQARALLTSRLKLTANYGYTHATFSKNQPHDGADYSGNYIPYIPRFTFFGGLQYRLPVNARILEALLINGGYQVVGRHYWNEANSFHQPAYGLINAMLTLEMRNFFVDLWARNIASEDYHSFSFSALGNNYVQQGRQATFGMNLRYNF